MADGFPDICKQGKPMHRVNVTTLPTQVSLSRLSPQEKKRFLATLEKTDPALHALLHSDGFRQLMQAVKGEYTMDQDEYRRIMRNAK